MFSVILSRRILCSQNLIAETERHAQKSPTKTPKNEKKKLHRI